MELSHIIGLLACINEYQRAEGLAGQINHWRLINPKSVSRIFLLDTKVGQLNIEMATLADELLNDFEDTGSETEEQVAEENGVIKDIPTAEAPASNGAAQNEPGMELDDDEEDVGETDESHGLSAAKAAQEAEDEEETKARIEKLQLRRVADVRSVAGLMKALAPVLEVSFSPLSLIKHHLCKILFSFIYVRDLQ